MRDTYQRKRAWMDKRGLCVWNGEWGPVYARREYDGEETENINERRYNVLKDQLDIYAVVRIQFDVFARSGKVLAARTDGRFLDRTGSAGRSGCTRMLGFKAWYTSLAIHPT